MNTQDDMTEAMQVAMLIDTYSNLQRIKSAADKDKEIEYQIKAAKMKLKLFDIAPENLDIC